MRCNISLAFFGFKVGGKRSDNFTAVCGRNTLPALAKVGMPSTPVMDSAGRQVRFNTNSVKSEFIGVMPAMKGNLSYTAVSKTFAQEIACCNR